MWEIIWNYSLIYMLSSSFDKLLHQIFFYRFAVFYNLGLKLIGHFVFYFLIIIICAGEIFYDMLLICV